MTTSKTIIVVFVLVAALCGLAIAQRYDGADPPQFIKAGRKFHTDIINGVYGGCREYWLWHAQERQMQVQNTPCPFGPYAADIVNHHIQDPDNVHIDGHDCGVFIEGNTGERMVTKDPSKHAEIEATSRLLDCTLHPELCVLQGGKLVQTQANNRTFFGQLSMYTTGESCTMDAAMEVIAGYEEIIWGYPSDEHFRDGWPGTEVYSDTVYKKSNFKTMPTVVITHVQVDRYRPLYAWQYRPDVPCPEGCMQVTSTTSETGFTCTKMSGI